MTLNNLAGILPRATAELCYCVTPLRRGRYEFGDIHVRWRLQLGLLVRQMRIKASDEVKVYPNVASLALRTGRHAAPHGRGRLGDGQTSRSRTRV